MSSRKFGTDNSNFSSTVKVVDARTWLDFSHGNQATCYWIDARNSWRIQSRSPKVSCYLRTLKCVRNAAYAVTGSRLTIWSFDGMVRKLRGLLRKLHALTNGELVSVELEDFDLQEVVGR